MNCAEVQNRLLEYLDRSLDEITAKHLEAHLNFCVPCRTEVDGLADCIRQVAALPIVDPPLGFAQRVMAHVREINTQPGFWQRMIDTWRLGKSIQAAAVVLVAALAFHLYQQESPRVLETTEVALNAAQEPPATDGNELTVTPLPARTSSSRAQTESSTSREATQLSPTPSAAPDASPAAASPAPVAQTEVDPRANVASQASRRMPLPVQEVATGRDSSRSARETFGIGEFPFGAALQSLRQPVAPHPVDRRFFTVNEPVADLEFVVRRRLAQHREPAEKVGSEPRREYAEPASATSTPATPVPPFLTSNFVETRWYTVAPEHLEHFKKDLAAETHIESEWTSMKREKGSATRPLAIKVVILPPGDR